MTLRLKRMQKALLLIVLAATILGFFLVPVFYLGSMGPPTGSSGDSDYNVYGSLGCVVLGFGDEYSSVTGLVLACHPLPTPQPLQVFDQL